MSLLIKTLVINDTNDISKLKELKDKRVKIILLNEKIFIETLRVDKKCNIEEKIEQLIKDRFFNYTPLVHYEVLKYNKSLFLIVYFIGCDERFKSLLYERKDFALTFPELKNKNILSFKKATFELKNLKISIYIKGKLVLLKSVKDSNIIEVIEESLKGLEKDFGVSLKDFTFKIQKEYLKEEIKELFKGLKLNEIRGEENLYQKYKNFLPIEYVEEYNRKIKKKLNIYILLLLLFNLFFYGKIKTENNKIKNYLSEIRGVNRERSLDKEFLEDINKLKEIIKDEKILNLNLERKSFEVEVNSIYKNSLINYINKINGRVYDISLNESNNTYRLKGELR
nr:hypothetical protein [Clostridium perfringens]